jgi:hypothetical protein
MAIYLLITAILIENVRFIKNFIGVKGNENNHFSRHKVFPVI